VSFVGFYEGIGDGQISVQSCHVNLWILSNKWWRFFSRHRLFVDVGLRFKAVQDVSEIGVVLPFEADTNSSIEDLSELILEPVVSALIFGRPTRVSGEILKYSGSSFGAKQISDTVVRVNSANCVPDRRATPLWKRILKDTKSGASERKTADETGLSKWILQFDPPGRGARCYYLRFRCKLNSSQRVWQSKGWGFAKKGFIASLRFNDTREAIADRESLNVKRLLPLPQIFVFLATPAYLLPKHVSPSLFYSRLLEPHVWERYLSSCGNYSKRNKISIHQWRSKVATRDTGRVDEDNPFRVYGDFSREFGFQLFLLYAAGILIPLTVNLISSVILRLLPNFWTDLLQQVRHLA
jgi:hypothetical protein